jgi:hypothetical protein
VHLFAVFVSCSFLFISNSFLCNIELVCLCLTLPCRYRQTSFSSFPSYIYIGRVFFSLFPVLSSADVPARFQLLKFDFTTFERKTSRRRKSGYDDYRFHEREEE